MNGRSSDQSIHKTYYYSYEQSLQIPAARLDQQPKSSIYGRTFPPRARVCRFAMVHIECLLLSDILREQE